MPPIEVEIDGVEIDGAEIGQVEVDRMNRQDEDARLAALLSTEILDTPPEPSYDAITRLAAEYFQADSVGLSFADESRVWIEVVLAAGGSRTAAQELDLRPGP